MAAGRVERATLTTYWRQHYRRPPLTGKFVICPVDVDSLTACEFLRRDPCLPGVLAIDCEHYMADPHDRVFVMSSKQPWQSWPDALKFYPIDKVGRPQSHGPFVCLIQISSADGSTVLFDLKKMSSTDLESVVELFGDKNIDWIGHDFGCDLRALDNTDSRLAKIKVRTDTKLIWDVLKHQRSMDHVADSLGQRSLDLCKIGIAFSIVDPGLAKICREMFGVEPSKDERGRGLKWAGHLKQQQLEYAALDSIVSMDVYLRINSCYEAFRKIHDALKNGPRNTKPMPLISRRLTSTSSKVSPTMTAEDIEMAGVGETIVVDDILMTVDDEAMEEDVDQPGPSGTQPNIVVVIKNDQMKPIRPTLLPNPTPNPPPVATSARSHADQSHVVVRRTTSNDGRPIYRIEPRLPMRRPVVSYGLTNEVAAARVIRRIRSNCKLFRSTFGAPKPGQTMPWSSAMQRFFDQTFATILKEPGRFLLAKEIVFFSDLYSKRLRERLHRSAVAEKIRRIRRRQKLEKRAALQQH